MHVNDLNPAYDVVIVGGGVGAGACATTLRDGGFDGSILVVCAEPHAPYTRPGLSKHVLRGDKPPSAALMKPAEWYDDEGIALVTGVAVTDIDRVGATVRVAGRSIAYGHLVLATGAEPRSLPVPADIRDRVHVLRSIEDADRLRPSLGDGRSWLVVGGGFIGAEVAASARMTGSDATIVMPEDVVMERAFGPAVGDWFTQQLRSHGVDVRSGASVTAWAAADGGKVAATLSDGTTLTVDCVVIGIGVVPSTGLAAQAGLDLDLGGVAVSAELVTSDERISAIGDIAAYDSELHGRRVRIEHWDVARSHGVHVAQRLLGNGPGAYRTLPYFFSGMADWSYAEYVGTASQDAVLRGGLDAGTLSAAYVGDDDRLVGVIVVGVSHDLDTARELVPAGVKIDRARFMGGAPLADCVRD